MDPKTALLHRLGAALTRGQGDFTEEDLTLAFEEIYRLMLQGQIASLVIEGKLNMRIHDGTVVYWAAEESGEPGEALPLEILIENMRSAEGP
jgi:hypothetical protein